MSSTEPTNTLVQPSGEDRESIIYQKGRSFYNELFRYRFHFRIEFSASHA